MIGCCVGGCVGSWHSIKFSLISVVVYLLHIVDVQKSMVFLFGQNNIANVHVQINLICFMQSLWMQIAERVMHEC